MSVRVIARVRPLLPGENEKDTIVRIDDEATAAPTGLRIPNPKNFAEDFTFRFGRVYGQESTQQQIFEAEVTPTIKHLFQGYDVTLFAYGSTGTGKTHTMRGGKSMADRGMIPRLLSSIYRKNRAIEKASGGETIVEVSMSYYEIYNDRVFDLFEPPEQRTATGLPIREAEGGKTVVVGLSEVPCSTLGQFEKLYDSANANRSTGATKLNAHSSRSHAVLCVKVTITGATETRVSTASAIDLAGSEDNRRTGNAKDRMVESASINKSLFVLAQCVEAIGKKSSRIPYRESKMTRILSLGQNNGFTVMILNLAPLRSYHLDTLSSLNFANRTKKIEVREVENEPIFKGPPRPTAGLASVTGPSIQRQPLRPLANGTNVNLAAHREAEKTGTKPAKAFSVYSDRSRPRLSPLKRTADSTFIASTRPTKTSRPTPSFIRRGPEPITQATIESLVEKKVTEILAARAMDAPPVPAPKDISDEVQKRLDSIEQRLAGQDGERAEGLSFLFLGKQHQARGEEGSALKMYELARPFFPDNEKLARKIEVLRARMQQRRKQEVQPPAAGVRRGEDGEDESYHDDDHSTYHEADDDCDDAKSTTKTKPKQHARRHHPRPSSPDPLTSNPRADEPPTPRTHHLLGIINTRDMRQLTRLPGLGPKRAETIVACLADMDEGSDGNAMLTSAQELVAIRGIGGRVVEAMRAAVLS